MGKTLYADYNATTPLCPQAIAKMSKAFEIWGNPSSAHRLGREATAMMQQAREAVAAAAGAKPSEVVFTSGGSEANNLALLGSRFQHGDGFRLVTTTVEHSSVRNTQGFLESTGAEVRKVPVSRSGELDWDALETLVKEFRPHLVSIMSANNETGVVYPIPRIAELCREAGVPLHTDAVQGFGKLPASHWAGADLVSVSAHKIQGPKGVGALIVRSGRQLVAMQYGGSQEVKRRGGTENTVGIFGFGGACEALPAPRTWENVQRMRDAWERALREALGEVTIQGEDQPRVANTTNIRFVGIPSEILMSALDMEGICVSAGSACSSGSVTPSAVLLALGLTAEEARECLRFSFGPATEQEDFDTIAQSVINHVKRIRDRRKRV